MDTGLKECQPVFSPKKKYNQYVNLSSVGLSLYFGGRPLQLRLSKPISVQVQVHGWNGHGMLFYLKIQVPNNNKTVSLERTPSRNQKLHTPQGNSTLSWMSELQFIVSINCNTAILESLPFLTLQQQLKQACFLPNPRQ